MLLGVCDLDLNSSVIADGVNEEGASFAYYRLIDEACATKKMSNKFESGSNFVAVWESSFLPDKLCNVLASNDGLD